MAALILITFILAPSYVVRFKLLGFPANLLMVWIFFLWLIFYAWLIEKKLFLDFIRFKEYFDKKSAVLTSLFLFVGIISLFNNGIDRAKLGQFIVLFLQPISFFFISSYVLKQNPQYKKLLLTACYLLLGLAGLYAIIQYFTLLGLPQAWWGNSVEPKRAISFFVHPNFYALWCTPLLALLIPDVANRIKDVGLRAKFWAILWLIGGAGLLLSFSRAGWLGLGAAIAIYFFTAADKKIRRMIFAGVAIVVVIIVAVPNLRWRILLPFYGEKSANSRIEIWNDGLKAIRQSPAFGLGLTGFAKEYSSLNSDPSLDTHNFPHNIFLNLWVETGLVGLMSLIGLIGLYIFRGLKNRHDILALGVSLFLIALMLQGQIDNPYFKNDLALVFWMVLALV